MKTMNKIAIWNPISDLSIQECIGLPSEVCGELLDIFEDCISPELEIKYVDFSWDDEDNEMYPAIAKYIAAIYNEYHFLIDFSTYGEGD